MFLFSFLFLSYKQHIEWTLKKKIIANLWQTPTYNRFWSGSYWSIKELLLFGIQICVYLGRKHAYSAVYWLSATVSRRKLGKTSLNVSVYITHYYSFHNFNKELLQKLLVQSVYLTKYSDTLIKVKLCKLWRFKKYKDISNTLPGKSLRKLRLNVHE